MGEFVELIRPYVKYVFFGLLVALTVVFAVIDYRINGE